MTFLKRDEEEAKVGRELRAGELAGRRRAGLEAHVGITQEESGRCGVAGRAKRRAAPGRAATPASVSVS